MSKIGSVVFEIQQEIIENEFSLEEIAERNNVPYDFVKVIFFSMESNFYESI